jgi:hypothetical protein
MLGRSDFINRFNLFDTMSALPQNRIWTAYQNVDNFSTGFGNLGFPTLPLTQRRIENLYRAGAEFKLGDSFSIAAEGEYVASAGTTANADAFSNPEFMVKWAAINNESIVISPVLGIVPEISQNAGELHEKAWRFLPGMLFLQPLGDRCFLQGGFQFNLATNGATNSFDHAICLGCWLCKDPNVDATGRAIRPDPESCAPPAEKRCLTGIIPQVEFFGKEILSQGSNLPYDPGFFNNPNTGFGGQTSVSGPGGATLSTSLITYRETRNVFDCTVGVRVILMERLSLGVGYSFPVGGGTVRQDEFLSSLSINF